MNWAHPSRCPFKGCEYSAMDKRYLRAHISKAHGLLPKIALALARLSEEVRLHDIRLEVARDK